MKKGKRIALIIGILAIVVIAVVAVRMFFERIAHWHGTAYASIVVEVFDEEHNPMEGVRISLIDFDFETSADIVLQNAITNDFGIALFTREFQASGLKSKRSNKTNIHTMWLAVRCEVDGFEPFETPLHAHKPEYFDGDIRPYVIPISVSMHRLSGESPDSEQ